MGYSFSQLIFLILGILYIMIIVYNALRLIHIRKFASDWYLAKYFYVTLLAINWLSWAWFLLLGLFEKIKQDQETGGFSRDDKRIFWSMILFPDALFLVAYLILSWQLLKLFVEGHSNTADEIYIPEVNSKSIGYKTLYFSLWAYVIVEGLLTAFYIIGKVTFYVVSIELSIFSIAIAGVVLFLFLIFSLIFSGTPYINKEYKNKTKTVFIVVIVWSVLKLFRGTFGIIKGGMLIETIISEFDGNGYGNEFFNIAILVMFLVWDVLPILIVLDSSIVHAFTIEAKRPDAISMLEWQLLDHNNGDDQESIPSMSVTKDFLTTPNLLGYRPAASPVYSSFKRINDRFLSMGKLKDSSLTSCKSRCLIS